MIALIDNYDSFTYNLVQLFGLVAPQAEIRVFRNDALTVEQLLELRPGFLVISPGPCSPAQGGISTACVRQLAGKAPILGVCLGHQCIAEAFGGRLIRSPGRPVHGKTSWISHDRAGVFAGIESPIVGARYHSLTVDPDCVPSELEVSATVVGSRDEIMGIRHRTLPIEGVQFHPESFLTPTGHKLLANFLRFG